jgi:two-component system sensor histidine kinase KdpD
LDADSKRKLVTVISEEAQLMSDLTIKILDMARLEAGNVVLNKQWYAPEEIIGSALRRLDQKLKSRKINILMADNLALIHIDAVLFQQVMVNLLENADKYSPAGLAIDISVEITELGLSIAVADRGPGIHESLQQKVFDKFFRVHEESAQSGVGLGLSICRAIIDAHAGKIQLTNRSGGGTLVQLYLPLLEYPPTIDPEEKL